VKLAVIGGTGFIGREIVTQAVHMGHNVRVLARTPHADTQDVTFVSVDIRDTASLTTAVAGSDMIINAAGVAHRAVGTVRDHVYHDTNAAGAAAVVRAAATSGVRRVVLLSSISVYGGSQPHTILDEGAVPTPSGAYACSKLAGEIAARNAATTYEIPLTILRLATVYGAGDPGNFARLIRAIYTGRFIQIGRGVNRKTLIHRSDVARGCLLAATDLSTSCNVFNLTGDIYTVQHIVGTISMLLGKSAWSHTLGIPAPSWLLALLQRAGRRGKTTAATINRWLADEAYSGKAFSRKYGFSPTYSLQAGLAEEITWLQYGADA
jgi:nucleoside-diphosphate-sugar epimerase